MARCNWCFIAVLPLAQLRRRKKVVLFIFLASLAVYLTVLHSGASHFSDSWRVNLNMSFSNMTISDRPQIGLCMKKTFLFDPNGWTKFPLLLPQIEPNISCEERQLFMVVVVNSDANDIRHRDSRTAIRTTWGKPTSNTPLKWRLFFSLGSSPDVATAMNNNHEALLHNDIIIGNFNDSYKNIIIKTFMSHFWVFSRFHCKYVLKTDDDVYVRVPWVYNWLNNVTMPRRRFYGGLIEYVANVFRTPGSKWYITEEQYKGEHWPPFAHGSFQVVSTDILPEYFNYTQFRMPFHADDAFFGVAARDLGIKVTDIPGFCFVVGAEECDLKTATAICHDISPTRIMSLHETYKSLKRSIEGYL
ncbi:beta-1,3-galactosyltransferase 5 [Exaiptasia diaphana]|uniref:Hexosyltransferase n=1 Tax=Exaiptasia diaphana TaxID=2652724 RepID=A0A913XW41_EXADI|nr:beta-1,3-galactosyltransferase 5 [Exaiptasia diaphana]XP_020910742.1 beta-1,3-galactosyltransferase 5 [Exaiptasia diaphana]XP_020910743.1 beta-1,3-galactosyltransferase 5 [Exaiptasia diaphana]XP_028517828.1 beta-1,3-galactosyltransferase 5 [Exaiptasia diaphana]KXJ08622.1 Beta-1,3-galactosyltransferase 1 [Exaiptasia diaphana]